MPRVLVLMLGLFVLGHAMSAEDVSEQAKAFLEKNSAKGARTEWLKKYYWKDPFSGEMPDQSHMLDKLKTWIVDNLKGDKLDDNKNKKPRSQRLTKDEKASICEWYLLFHEKGWALPQVAPYDEFDKFITMANFKEWIDPQAQLSVVQDAQ